MDHPIETMSSYYKEKKIVFEKDLALRHVSRQMVILLDRYESLIAISAEELGFYSKSTTTTILADIEDALQYCKAIYLGAVEDLLGYTISRIK